MFIQVDNSVNFKNEVHACVILVIWDKPWTILDRWPTLTLCVCLTQSCFLFCQFSFMYMCSHLISITMISSCTYYMFTCRAHILSYRPKWCCIIFKSKIFSNCFLKILKMQRGCQIVLSSYYLFPSRLQSVPHSLVCLKFIFMHLAHLEDFP